MSNLAFRSKNKQGLIERKEPNKTSMAFFQRGKETKKTNGEEPKNKKKSQNENQPSSGTGNAETPSENQHEEPEKDKSQVSFVNWRSQDRLSQWKARDSLAQMSVPEEPEKVFDQMSLFTKNRAKELQEKNVYGFEDEKKDPVAVVWDHIASFGHSGTRGPNVDTKMIDSILTREKKFWIPKSSDQDSLSSQRIKTEKRKFRINTERFRTETVEARESAITRGLIEGILKERVKKHIKPGQSSQENFDLAYLKEKQLIKGKTISNFRTLRTVKEVDSIYSEEFEKMVEKEPQKIFDFSKDLAIIQRKNERNKTIVAQELKHQLSELQKKSEKLRSDISIVSNRLIRSLKKEGEAQRIIETETSKFDAKIIELGLKKFHSSSFHNAASPDGDKTRRFNFGEAKRALELEREKNQLISGLIHGKNDMKQEVENYHALLDQKDQDLKENKQKTKEVTNELFQIYQYQMRNYEEHLERGLLQVMQEILFLGKQIPDESFPDFIPKSIRPQLISMAKMENEWKAVLAAKNKKNTETEKAGGNNSQGMSSHRSPDQTTRGLFMKVKEGDTSTMNAPFKTSPQTTNNQLSLEQISERVSTTKKQILSKLHEGTSTVRGAHEDSYFPMDRRDNPFEKNIPKEPKYMAVFKKINSPANIQLKRKRKESRETEEELRAAAKSSLFIDKNHDLALGSPKDLKFQKMANFLGKTDNFDNLSGPVGFPCFNDILGNANELVSPIHLKGSPSNATLNSGRMKQPKVHFNENNQWDSATDSISSIMEEQIQIQNYLFQEYLVKTFSEKSMSTLKQIIHSVYGLKNGTNLLFRMLRDHGEHKKKIEKNKLYKIGKVLEKNPYQSLDWMSPKDLGFDFVPGNELHFFTSWKGENE